MEKEAISAMLKANEKDIYAFFTSRNDAIWEKKPEGKWQAGQHIIHLIQSTKPLVKALTLYPKFVLKWKFGVNNRANKSYEEVVQKYHEKLALVPGLVSPFSASMPYTKFADRERYFKELSDLNQALNRGTEKIKPQHLDTILLPHPLMGKMTLREILMWNAYHTKHHLDILNKKYL